MRIFWHFGMIALPLIFDIVIFHLHEDFQQLFHLPFSFVAIYSFEKIMKSLSVSCGIRNKIVAIENSPFLFTVEVI